MAISATFNIGDLSPYVEDCFEDTSDLRANPLEEGEVDAKQCIQVSSLNWNDVHDTNQGQEDHGQKVMINHIPSLLFYSNLELTMVFDGLIVRVSKTSYGRVLLCWTP